MNLESNIQLAVTVITAIITLSYLWKTRVIGADKELIAKYKSDYEEEKKRHVEYKKKYEDKRKQLDDLGIQYDMLNSRYSELRGRVLAMENQPYWPNNHSLEVSYDPDKPVTENPL